jgi:hypothetical protein
LPSALRGRASTRTKLDPASSERLFAGTRLGPREVLGAWSNHLQVA